MGILHNEIISQIDKDLKDQIRLELNQRFNYFNEKILIRTSKNDKSAVQLMHEYNKKKPITVLSMFLNCIEEYDYRTEFEIKKVKFDVPYNVQINNSSDKHNNLIIYHNVNLNKFDIVIDVYEPKICIGNDEFENYSLDIIDFNHFTKNVYIQGLYCDNMYCIDHFELSKYKLLELSLEVYAIQDVTKISDFLIYLIEGIFHFNYKNNKIALFSLFSAYESFIKELHSIIFNLYVENYHIMIMNYKTELEKKIQLKENNYNNEIIDFDVYLKEKIKRFSKDEKSISQKVNNIFYELGIKCNNGFVNKYKYLSKPVKIMSKLEQDRNKVAHGNNISTSDIEIMNVIYSVLTVMIGVINDKYIEDILEVVKFGK